MCGCSDCQRRDVWWFVTCDTLAVAAGQAVPPALAGGRTQQVVALARHRHSKCQMQLTSVWQHVHHTDRSLRRQVRGPQQERECNELQQQSSQAEIARENAQVSCCCCCCRRCSNTLLPGTKPQSCGPCHPALPLLTRRALTSRSCGLRAARYGQCLRCARIAHGCECRASARGWIAFAPQHPLTSCARQACSRTDQRAGFTPWQRTPLRPCTASR